MGLLKQPVVVGNPAFTDPCTTGLVQLAGAEEEAKQVSALIGAEPLTGPALLQRKIILPHAEFKFYLSRHTWLVGYRKPVAKQFHCFERS